MQPSIKGVSPIILQFLMLSGAHCLIVVVFFFFLTLRRLVRFLRGAVRLEVLLL